jgi:hypothetical protein
MRGGMTYDEILDLSFFEKKRAYKFIEDRMEKIKDHPFPIY